ncbi:GNAT family N-acetyltransferase [Streptomyces pimonensis]|uniref:GNAT family N-acetyltransferase n=1 Tax=Streptomyces pimonensis TaxID=2860288 RepID=A0ABV4J2U8_9ACTN
MDTTGKPLFCDIDLAKRIERAEVQLITNGSVAAHRRNGEGTGFLKPVMEGVASFAEKASPLNKVAGLGFGGVPDDVLLDEIEQAYADRGAPVQVELAHLADPDVGAVLTERGYQLTSYENVLGFPLSGKHGRLVPEGIGIRPSGEEELERWIEVIADGFAHPDTQGVPSQEEFPREVIAAAVRDLVGAAGMRRYSAVCDGAVVGGASVRMTDGIAQLTGAATAPAHRRRGVQTALLAARLADAAAVGCDIAVVTTQPGSKSQENAQRQGFHLLYTRAILVKQT